MQTSRHVHIVPNHIQGAGTSLRFGLGRPGLSRWSSAESQRFRSISEEDVSASICSGADSRLPIHALYDLFGLRRALDQA